MDERYYAPETARLMQAAAGALLDSLTREQRADARFAFSDEAARTDWDFIPKSGRLGLPLRRMDARQRVLAQQLIATGVSLPTYTKVLAIMGNENLLRERQLGRWHLAAAEWRSGEGYYFSFFGQPNFEETWGWRVVGHHCSITYTIVSERYLAPTPFLLGAEPGSFGAFAPLNEEEDLGFRLLDALDPEQRRAAVIHDVAPADAVTRVVPYIGAEERPDEREVGLRDYTISDRDRDALTLVRDAPRGVCGAGLSAAQRSLLGDLVSCYLGRAPAEVAEPRRADLAEYHFCWAGATRRGEPHYYRVQGPSFLAEFTNAQHGANHIHSVWRDPDNDFGRSLLAEQAREEGSAPEPPIRHRRLTPTREP